MGLRVWGVGFRASGKSSKIGAFPGQGGREFVAQDSPEAWHSEIGIDAGIEVRRYRFRCNKYGIDTDRDVDKALDTDTDIGTDMDTDTDRSKDAKASKDT